MPKRKTLLPIAPIRAIMKGNTGLNISKKSIMLVHEALVEKIADLTRKAQALAKHRKAKTITPADMILALKGKSL
jgi:histone H3/H4